MNAPQQNLISRTGGQMRAAKNLIELTKEIDTLYSGTANYAAEITDATIAEVASFAAAGVTKANLDAAIYILKQINVALETIDFPAVVMLANL
jgi:uncharacterized membrane protein